MDYKVKEDRAFFSERSLIILAAVIIIVCLTTSIVLYAVTEQWERRVLFFPNLNTIRFEGEIRYFPKLDSRVEDIRMLLSDTLLGSSNYANSNVLPAKTRLDSLMLENGTVYIGFSDGVYHLENKVFTPRQMLQGVANTVFFNFNDVREVRFFISGKEISDITLESEKAERSFALQNAVSILSNLKASISVIRNHAVLSTPARTDYYFFANGARFDDSIF
ncbi:MAG: GerMN domain-containing protein [Spirochaetales bacterium]|nr:GerMN domain-containing protein [Spirochaetales bacterium]